MKKDLNTKIVDLKLACHKKESQVYVEHLCTRIKFYEEQINILKKNKPYWFQKRKLKKYNDRLKEYQNKIYDIYKKIEEELNE